MSDEVKLNPSRIDLRDLNNNIFRPFSDKPQSLEIDTETIPEATAYTITGQQDDLDENGYPVLWDTEYEKQNGETYIVKAADLDEAFAKKTVSGKRIRYYVKQDSNGHLYNPSGLYSVPGKHNRDIKKAGGLQWKFREVNLKVFELYMSFLMSNNPARLLNAEREYLTTTR